MRRPPKKVVLFGLLVICVALIATMVIVLLTAKPQLDLAYKINTEIQANSDLNYIKINIATVHNDMDKVDMSTSGNTKEKIKAGTAVLNGLDAIGEKIDIGLLYLSRTKDYDKNVKELEKLWNDTKSELRDCKGYLETTYLPYSKNNTVEYIDLARYLNTFKDYYYQTIQSLNEIHCLLIHIYTQSADEALQVNKLTKLNAETCKIWATTIVEDIVENETIPNITNFTAQCSKNFENATQQALDSVSKENISNQSIIEHIVAGDLNTFVNQQENKDDYKSFILALYGIAITEE